MKTRFFLFVAMITFFSGSGCAPTLKMPLALQTEIDKERETQIDLMLVSQTSHAIRLLNVSDPLLVAASSECENATIFKYGYKAHQKNFYEEKSREAASRVLGATDELTVLHVVPGMPAAKSGLLKGDKILRINNNDISGKLFTPEDADLSELQDAPILEMEVERNGKTKIFKMDGIRACNYSVKLVINGAVNAFADGKNILIHSGLMQFTKSDTELAMVIAHEISHNILGHNGKKRVNAVFGFLFGGVDNHTGEINTYTKEFESEADYFGLHIMARANMDISFVADFWRRLATEQPDNIVSQKGAVYPSTPERFVLMEKTIEKIKRKQMDGFAVVPDIKGRPLQLQ